MTIIVIVDRPGPRNGAAKHLFFGRGEEEDFFTGPRSAADQHWKVGGVGSISPPIRFCWLENMYRGYRLTIVSL